MTRIAVVEGDGIGHEVIPVAQKVLALLHPEYRGLPGRDGYGRWERTGCPCADADIAALKPADAVLFGAVTTPPMKDYQSVVLRIRKALDLYANLRPVKGEGFDIMIVRENTEGLYLGIEETGFDRATTLRVVTRAGTERVARAAIRSCTAAAGQAHHRAQGKRAQIRCLLPRPLYRRGAKGRGIVYREVHRCPRS